MESIGHGRILFDSDIPFETMEPCEIRRSMVDLSLEGLPSRVTHSSSDATVHGYGRRRPRRKL